MNEVDELLLEHFGTKGMKWGVRKAKSGAIKTGRAAKSGAIKTGKAIKKHPKISASIFAGTAFTIALLVSRGKTKPPKVNRDLTTPFLAKFGNTPKTVWSTPGPIQTSQHQDFIRSINEKQKRLNSAANQHLRSMYRENDTPIAIRDYLPV